MRLLLAVLPLMVYSALANTKLFESTAPQQRNLKERKWLFRVLTSSLLTLQIGKRGLDTWWGMIILVISQLLLVEVTDFSESSLNSFSRMLIPSQVGLILMQDDTAFARTAVLAFLIRIVAALFVTPTLTEHICQLAVLVPSMVLTQMHNVDEAFLTRIALMVSISILVPLALDDITQSMITWNDRIFNVYVPQVEQIVLAKSTQYRWAVFVTMCISVSVVVSFLFETNLFTNYDFLWNSLAAVLLVVSVFTWGMSYANSTSSASPTTALRSPATPATPIPIAAASNSLSTSTTNLTSNSTTTTSTKDTDQVGFLQRAQQEDLLTFQACLSFIHMLIVLFMTSIDLPHLALVNLIIIASLLFQNHTPQSLRELVSGVVVSQSLSLFVLRYQLQDALAAARVVDPNAQLLGVDAVAEQVGLVFCSIRLVAGAILTENFSRHAAETLLLAGVSIYCCSGYSTKYLCLVMMGMSIFASRIKASTVSLAISWLNSEYELRRFMDHELRVSFAGIMLALEHCLQSEKDEARLPEDTIQMLNDALAECKRGKELCFQATMQRLAYDNAYELQIEGKTLDDGIQQNYHNVVTEIHVENDSLRQCIVHTDWNLVNHILDNAVANGSKYGTNVVMKSTLELTGEESNGFTPAVLRLRVTNIPYQNERFQALLKIKDNSMLFEYTPADNEDKKSGGGGGPTNLWSLGGPTGGRNSSTHIGLPVAKVFANRLGGKVQLIAEPHLATFLLDVPVVVSPAEHSNHMNSNQHQVQTAHNDLAFFSFLSPSQRHQPALDNNGPQQQGSRLASARSSEDGELSAINEQESAALSRASSDETEIPAGLTFASLDDSAMIRSTIECMLYREFKASDRSIVRGSTADEAASFAKQVVELQADICIVDENLDYDEVAFVGTNVVKELRSLGYDGVVVLYSANEKIGTKLNLELVDGFASKSATRLETKQLLAGIYWNKRAKKRFVSTLSERVFVSSDASKGALSMFPSSERDFSPTQHRIAILGVDSPLVDRVHELDPTVITIGIVKDTEPAMFAYSPFVRFAHVGMRDIEIPSLMSNKVEEKYLQLFSRFDLVCSASQLDKCDFPLLVQLGLTAHRFKPSSVTLDQAMMKEVLLDFGPPAEQMLMINTMNQSILQGLERINKRPTTEGVRKIAHMIKGSSVQIGAKALHEAASKLERSCMDDYKGGADENWRLYCHFILLMLDFMRVSSTLAVNE